MDDQQIVAAQIRRPLRSRVKVVARCPLGLPVVAKVPPLLDDGTPFPTRYWLTCPLAVRRIGRLESAGGVEVMERRAGDDDTFRAGLERAHARYAAERDRELPAETPYRPQGGVGGAHGGIKCLHAHYADHAAGNDNPVGEMVAPWVEPLDCTIPCVAEIDGEVGRNPDWREPK
ncbi:MAG: DUF501 domain-containing protein [Acidimicrobiia bacterium]